MDVANKWENQGAMIPFHAISEHQESANWAVWFFSILLILRTMAVLKKKFAGYIKYVFLVLAIVGMFIIYRTGELGGKLVYKYGVGTQLLKPESK